MLPGFPLRTDAKVVRHPERYTDERGRRMWELVSGLLVDLDGEDTPSAGATLKVAPAPPPPLLFSYRDKEYPPDGTP